MINLLTPFTQVPRRSCAYDTDLVPGLITGRWAAINASGVATLPVAGQAGAYLVLEGSHQPKPDVPTVIGAGPGFLPSPLVPLPSSLASGQAALAYGIFRFSVDIEGFDPTGLSVGAGLQVDAVGRLILLAGGVRVATVEAFTSTNLIARALGA